MKHVAVFAALVLCFVGQDKQQNSQEPDLSSKRVAAVMVSYSKEDRLGEILFSDSEDRLGQYLDVWGKSPKDFTPVVITYVLDKRDAKGRRFYTATWGKGPIERSAFHPSCLSNVPDFKDDVYWAAKVIEGQVQFEPLEDSVLKEGAIKVLFRSVKGTVQRWMFESARPVISQSPYDDQRILADMVNREENRKTWYTKGWLRSENRCVRYLHNK
jgi:hypothetical protein